MPPAVHLRSAALPPAAAVRGLLALLAAVVLALPQPSASRFLPGPVTRTVGGAEYSISTTECRPMSSCNTQMRVSAVWGNKTLSKTLAAAVGGALGNVKGYGPMFPYEMLTSSYIYVMHRCQVARGGSQSYAGKSMNTFTIAVARSSRALLQAPEPSSPAQQEGAAGA